jgi:hypothetical protein
VSSSYFTDEAPVRVTPVTPVAAQLARAFDALARESAGSYREVLRRLDHLRVRIRVDDERFDVATDAARGLVQVDRAAGDARVTIETTRAVVRDVLAGRCTLAEVLRAGSLTACGTLRDLVAVLHALEAFVHGAARSRETARMFGDFQTEGVV